MQWSLNSVAIVQSDGVQVFHERLYTHQVYQNNGHEADLKTLGRPHNKKWAVGAKPTLIIQGSLQEFHIKSQYLMIVLRAAVPNRYQKFYTLMTNI